jgi:hypothetical protein
MAPITRPLELRYRQSADSSFSPEDKPSEKRTPLERLDVDISPASGEG